MCCERKTLKQSDDEMRKSWAAGVQGLHQTEGEGGLSGVKNEKEPPTEKKWSPREREPQVQTLRGGRAGSTGRKRSVWPAGRWSQAW